MIALNALVAAILVKLLIETENPLLCAGFYTALVLIGQLMVAAVGQLTFFGFVGAMVLGFGLSYAYFWVLNKIEIGAPLWWIVLVAGPVVMFFL